MSKPDLKPIDFHKESCALKNGGKVCDCGADKPERKGFKPEKEGFFRGARIKK